MTIDMKIEKQMSQITALNAKCEELNTQKENEKKTLLEEPSYEPLLNTLLISSLRL